MKIGLVSGLMKDNDVKNQLNVMERYLRENKKCDLLCFGECFLQGSKSLTWDYEQDKNIAVPLESDIIFYIKELTKKYSCGVSFSFFESFEEDIYCSNIVVDKSGEIVDLYRKSSEGWKDESASSEYKQGEGFHKFSYNDFSCVTAICGDLWKDENIDYINSIDAEAILWPFYIGEAMFDWYKDSKDEMIKHTSKINKPILMINSYEHEVDGAKGGCYLFNQGEVMESLELGNQGVLEIDVDSLKDLDKVLID